MNTIDYNIMDEKEQDNTHLTFDNRKTIAHMLNSKKPKYTLDDIGTAVGKTKSCIFKEIVNNVIDKGTGLTRYKVKKIKKFIRKQSHTIEEASIEFKINIKDATTVANGFKHVTASQRDKIQEGLD